MNLIAVRKQPKAGVNVSELVKRIASAAGKFGRPVATPAEARRILGLRA